jgi:hypothetical protein
VTLGGWYAVEARWADGTGTGLHETPVLDAVGVDELRDPPPRREDLG